MGVLTIRKDNSAGTVLHTESFIETPSYAPSGWPVGSITSGLTFNCKNKVPTQTITIGGKTFWCKNYMMDRSFWAKFDTSVGYDVYKDGTWASGLSANSLISSGPKNISKTPVFYKTFESSSFKIASARTAPSLNVDHGAGYLNLKIPWGSAINGIEIESGAANNFMHCFLLETKPSTSDFWAYYSNSAGTYSFKFDNTTVSFHYMNRWDGSDGTIPANAVTKFKCRDTISKDVYLFFSDGMQDSTFTTIKRITLLH